MEALDSAVYKNIWLFSLLLNQILKRVQIQFGRMSSRLIRKTRAEAETSNKKQFRAFKLVTNSPIFMYSNFLWFCHLSCIIALSNLQRNRLFTLHLHCRKGIARPQSKFPHTCVCERFIYSQDRSTYFPAAEYADRSWEYINRSQTRELACMWVRICKAILLPASWNYCIFCKIVK